MKIPSTKLSSDILTIAKESNRIHKIFEHIVERAEGGKRGGEKILSCWRRARFDRSSSYYSDPHLLQSLVGYFKIAVL